MLCYATRYYNAFGDAPAAWDDVANRLQLYDVQQSSLFVSDCRALEALVA